MEKKKKTAPLAVALRLLYYRDRTINGLKKKLLEKGLSEDDITNVLKVLIGDGLLNDERFAVDLASSRIRNKQWGPRKISMDLMRKGVPGEIADKVVSSLDRESVELSALKALKKWTARKGLCLTEGLEASDFKKAYHHLESRGFSGELILRLLHKSNNKAIAE